ncbi:diguanylate cyclase (GGDEF) domain-containing protein [Quadrisphaera granulorum]|uniref:Diguanylate cyclase (GGDEF)-like protein n=1 Tax=Quadrisphaera granulorum TaxID=317664 RepID=A0A316AEA0_9ACTN|nr:diguanylate cyclase (GGDEF)-like protein [Quadrisphaera granulorum]SZE95713.1 diguanylate cyclase (GGDEF) domain-containing protein [Quadrisphaera granulorum]
MLWTAVLLACALCCATGVAVAARRGGRAMRCVVAQMTGAAAWSAAAAVLSTAPGPSTVTAARIVTTAGALAVACGGYWLSRVAQDPHRRPDRGDLAVLVVAPVITMGMLLTNPWHQLAYVDQLIDSPPGVRWGDGPLYPLLLAVIGVPAVLTLVHLGRGITSSPAHYRPHLRRILIGGVAVSLSIVASMATTSRWHHSDLVPLGLAVAALAFVHGVLRNHHFAVVPLARSQVVEDLPDAVLVTDTRGVVLDVNGSCRTLLTRLAVADAIGRPLHEVLPFLAPPHEGAGARGEVSPAPGLHLDVRSSTIRSPRGAPVGHAVLLRDVSAVVERQMAAERTSERLAQEVSLDPLTGLLNRRGLHAAASALPEGGQLAVVIVDLDHFKAVNDEHGHEAGDAVLRALSALLLDAVLPHLDRGAAATRLGGEEFALLLPGLDADGATAVGQRVLSTLRSTTTPVPSLGGTVHLRVTASAGVAAGTGRDVSELLRRADAALYRAKGQGRDALSVAYP